MVRGWARSRFGRIWIVGICVVGFAAAALVAAELRADQYTATSTLVFRGQTFGEALLGRLTPESAKSGPTPAGIEALVSAPIVAKKTAETLPGNHSPAEIAEKVDARVNPGNNVIALTATDADPETAAEIADTYAEESAALLGFLAQRRVGPAIQAVRQEGREAGGGRGRDAESVHAEEAKIARLEALAALQIGEIEQVEAATPPSSASSAHALTDALLGAMIGLAVGAAVAILLAQTGRRVGTARALEDELGAPVITAFGNLDAVGEEGPDGPGFAELPPDIVEMLRARIRYYGADRDLRRLLLTSAKAGSGKSTLAWNLARRATAAGVRTILIEVDPDETGLASSAGYGATPGLAELLAGQVEPDAATQSTPGDGAAAEADDLPTVITAGTPPQDGNPPIAARAIGDLLRRLETEGYELVLFDAGPYPGNEARKADLLREVDGVIAVVGVDSTTPGEVRRLGERLRADGAPLIGAVATFVSHRDPYAAALTAGQAEPLAPEAVG